MRPSSSSGSVRAFPIPGAAITDGWTHLKAEFGLESEGGIVETASEGICGKDWTVEGESRRRKTTVAKLFWVVLYNSSEIAFSFLSSLYLLPPYTIFKRK